MKETGVGGIIDKKREEGRERMQNIEKHDPVQQLEALLHDVKAVSTIPDPALEFQSERPDNPSIYYGRNWGGYSPNTANKTEIEKTTKEV